MQYDLKIPMLMHEHNIRKPLYMYSEFSHIFPLIHNGYDCFDE